MVLFGICTVPTKQNSLQPMPNGLPNCTRPVAGSYRTLDLLQLELASIQTFSCGCILWETLFS